ncbi:DUF3108 domain-containing protein [Limnohabitans sp.]|uniref:DUF3108 domain-containing protein n=1 Tax=Limnohabitans sp. TaxID=1907725 RepID=UPI00286FA717|nr:DUF3108 domain-containing protein [Limnohabitans sp.]
MLTTPATPHLKRSHATLLVLAVLLLHWWVLAGAPLWWSPEKRQTLRPQAMVTRTIEASTPRAAQVPTVKPNRMVRTPPPDLPQPPQAQSLVDAQEHPQHASELSATTPHAASASMAKPDTPPLASSQELADLTAPVALPARSASAVDLPPFKRAASNAPDAPSFTEVTSFKAPASTVLTYRMQGQSKGLTYWATGELLWQQDGQRYDAKLEVSAFLIGTRTQTSTGTLGPEGLMPTRFGDKSRSELAAHFQRDKNIISFSANSPSVPLLKGAQDRLSVIIQLGALLAGDPARYPTGTMLSFQTASQREAEVWQFSVEKEETLQLPYGSVVAVKLNRSPRREFDQRIEVWLAPEFGYLPVRLRVTNANGDWIDQTLKGVEKPSP